MIINFEKETHELTKFETDHILPKIISFLRDKKGKNNSTTNFDIINYLKKFDIKIGAPRIRKIIHFIRVENKIPLLLATNSGYYISNDKNEIMEYLKSLEQRINSIKEIQYSVSEQIKYLDSPSGREIKQMNLFNYGK